MHKKINKISGNYQLPVRGIELVPKQELVSENEYLGECIKTIKEIIAMTNKMTEDIRKIRKLLRGDYEN